MRSQNLTHFPLDKTAAISQAIFSNAFSWMKSFVSWLKFHWNLFLKVWLTISQHCMRWWLGTKQTKYNGCSCFAPCVCVCVHVHTNLPHLMTNAPDSGCTALNYIWCHFALSPWAVWSPALAPVLFLAPLPLALASVQEPLTTASPLTSTKPLQAQAHFLFL